MKLILGFFLGTLFYYQSTAAYHWYYPEHHFDHHFDHHPEHSWEHHWEHIPEHYSEHHWSHRSYDHGYCFNDEHGRVSTDVVKDLGPALCGQVKCLENGNASITTCNVPNIIGADCILVAGDQHKSYPDCCPKSVCSPPPPRSHDYHEYYEHHEHHHDDDHDEKK